MIGLMAPARFDDRCETQALTAQIYRRSHTAVRTHCGLDSSKVTKGDLHMHHLPQQYAKGVDVAPMVVRSFMV